MWNLSENFKCHVSAIQKFSHPIEITVSWKSTKYSFYCFIRSVVKNTPQVKTKDTFKDIPLEIGFQIEPNPQVYSVQPTMSESTYGYYCWMSYKNITRCSVEHHLPKWFCTKPDGWAFSTYEVCCIPRPPPLFIMSFLFHWVFTEWNVSHARGDLLIQVRLLNKDTKYVIHSSKYLT